MNIFTAIGTITTSLTSMIVELCGAGETAARTVRKTAGIAETTVDQMAAEQQQELAAISKPVRQPRTKKTST